MEGTRNWTWLAVAAIVGASLIASTAILTEGIKVVKGPQHNLMLKGSAREQIKSDYASWTGSFSTTNPNLQDAYKQLEADMERVREFMKQNGFTESELAFSSVTTNPVYEMLSNGVNSNRVEAYKLSQTVEIKSAAVDKIAQIARTSTELINQGVTFESYPPQYYYTKLADKKIKMIEQATGDARARATVLLKSSGKTPGSLISASVGVFQITPPFSNEVADEGINDTSSIDKEITAVVNCEFEIQ